MNKATHWIIKIILIIAILFVALMWKAATRDATGASSPVPGAIAGVAILALLAMKVKGNRKSPEAPPAPTPLPPAKTSPTPLPVPQKQPPLARPIIQHSQIVPSPQPKPPIMKPEPDEKPPAATVMDNEAFYEQVAGEIESDAMKPGIWARAFAETDGENDRAKALYIRLRVAQLVSAREVELEDVSRLMAERAIEEEQAKREATARGEAENEAAKQESAKLQREQDEAERVRKQAVEAEVSRRLKFLEEEKKRLGRSSGE